MDQGVAMPSWGADAQYTRLIADRGDELLRLATMLLRDPHDAEDIVQDVLIGAARSWPIAKPMPYLKRAVSNRCLDLIRRRREMAVADVPERAYVEPGFLVHDDTREFYRLVQHLPERQRQTVILRYLADFDDATIARLLEVSIHTVRSQSRHALDALRQTVKEMS
jgi:RNA polymerase sigma factor (sigma-70 family)